MPRTPLRRPIDHNSSWPSEILGLTPARGLLHAPYGLDLHLNPSAASRRDVECARFRRAQAVDERYFNLVSAVDDRVVPVGRGGPVLIDRRIGIDPGARPCSEKRPCRAPALAEIQP